MYYIRLNISFFHITFDFQTKPITRDLVQLKIKTIALISNNNLLRIKHFIHIEIKIFFSAC